MKARALYVVSRSPPDAAVSVRYPSKINICWWLRPTLFILLGLGCGLWSADVRLWFAFLFSSHLPADVQMFRNIKVVFVGLAAFWIAHYHTSLTIWTLKPPLDTRYEAKHLMKRCLYILKCSGIENEDRKYCVTQWNMLMIYTCDYTARTPVWTWDELTSCIH